MKIELELGAVGWTVRQSNGLSIWPTSTYPNAVSAARRVLQLMEIHGPVLAQDWPERVEIGTIETRGGNE